MRRNRKRGSKRLRKDAAIPRTSADYFAMSERAQDRWNLVPQVVSKMKADEISLQKASREFGIAPRTVARLGRDALRKNKSGRYEAKPIDTLLRVVMLPKMDGGLREVGTANSGEASIVGKYWAAVQKYLETGDSSALRKIRRKTIQDENGRRVRLIKDVAELERLGSAGLLSFETIYAKAA